MVLWSHSEPKWEIDYSGIDDVVFPTKNDCDMWTSKANPPISFPLETVQPKSRSNNLNESDLILLFDQMLRG